MQKLLITILAVICGYFGAIAERSTITGYIPGAENNKIRLLTYSDLITYSEIVLDLTIIDSSGFFKLEIDNAETAYCMLDLDYYASGIFIEPGSAYQIVGDTIREISPFKAFYEKSDLIYSIDSLPDTDLNFLISEFNLAFNDFIITNFDAIYRRRNKTMIPEFREEVSKSYSHINNIYFSDYVEYKIASIELATASFKKPLLFDTYIKDKKVQYSHLEYMQFFNEFFDQYISSQSKIVTQNDLITTVNYQDSYTAILDTLGKDTLLKNEVIRELVLIKTLRELYNNPKFSQQNILSILNQLVSTTVFDEHKVIARNTIKELSKLENGTLAPQFTLPALNDSLVSLSDFQGKPVYLSFLATWSVACLGEYKLLDSLYFRYGDNINFITVSLDKNPEILDQFVNDKGYDWLFLYNGTDYDLINLYDIKTFPIFVLIDAEGRILQYPAYKPSEIIEEAFRKLVE